MTLLRAACLLRARQRISSFLLNETNPPPLLYFIVFLYFHYPFETPTQSFSSLLFLFALVTLLTCNFNFLFTMAPFLSVSPIVAVPMLAIIILSCN
jgi:hypothetical protein